MYNIAIIGATGNVGRMFLSILEERNFPINELFLFASKKSNGTYLKFKDKNYLVQETIEDNIRNKKRLKKRSIWNTANKIPSSYI